MIPKTTKHFDSKLSKKKEKKSSEVKQLYKLKMFEGVDSKVRQNLNNFKTYNAKKDNIDCLIEKVENELKEMHDNQGQSH